MPTYSCTKCPTELSADSSTHNTAYHKTDVTAQHTAFIPAIQPTVDAAFGATKFTAVVSTEYQSFDSAICTTVVTTFTMADEAAFYSAFFSAKP